MASYVMLNTLTDPGVRTQIMRAYGKGGTVPA